MYLKIWLHNNYTSWGKNCCSIHEGLHACCDNCIQLNYISDWITVPPLPLLCILLKSNGYTILNLLSKLHHITTDNCHISKLLCRQYFIPNQICGFQMKGKTTSNVMKLRELLSLNHIIKKLKRHQWETELLAEKNFQLITNNYRKAGITSK
jgi:hypothetical protein